MRVKRKNTTYKSSKFRDVLVRILTYSNKNIVIYSGNFRLRKRRTRKKNHIPIPFTWWKKLQKKTKEYFIIYDCALQTENFIFNPTKARRVLSFLQPEKRVCELNFACWNIILRRYCIVQMHKMCTEPHCAKTKISSNFLVYKLFGKTQFPQSFGLFAWNSTEAVPFHKIFKPGN